VTVINGSDELLEGFEFDTQCVRDQDGNDQNGMVAVEPIHMGRDTSINPRGSRTFNLKIQVQNPPEQLTGELLVKAKNAEGVGQGRRSFMISEPPAPLSSNELLFNQIVIVSLIVASIFILPLSIWRGKRFCRPLSEPIDWDPKASWAATLTTVGGVGGVLLAT